MNIEPAEFRKVVGTIATGVTIVTTRDFEGEPNGATANSFASVSLQPPLILICIDRRSNSLSEIHQSRIFAVNILARNQQALSDTFASKQSGKFRNMHWRSEQTGSPILSGCLGWFDWNVDRIISAGDHDVVVCSVQAFGRRDGEPLGYFCGRYSVIAVISCRDGLQRGAR